MHVEIRTQAVLLEIFDPPSSKLHIEVEEALDDEDRDSDEEDDDVGDNNNDNGLTSWERIVHPSVAARLGHITFTSLSYTVTSLTLTESDVTETQRGALTLRVDSANGALNLLERETRMFNLSRIHTLQPNHHYFSAAGLQTLNQNGFIGGTRALADSVTTLVLSAGIWNEPNLVLGLKSLRTMSLHFPGDLRRRKTDIKDFVLCLRERHGPRNAKILTPVTRVVVEMDCWRKKLSREEIELLESVPGLEFKGCE